MKRYDVCLRFGELEFVTPRMAAENIFKAYFSESLFQPRNFEVNDMETGESFDIDVSHFHTNNYLYGPEKISRKLRDEFSFVVSESFIIPGKGSVLTGVIKSGVVKAGDTLKINGNDNFRLIVEFIELNRNLVREAYFTEKVGLMFRDVDLSFCVTGNTLVKIN